MSKYSFIPLHLWRKLFFLFFSVSLEKLVRQSRPSPWRAAVVLKYAAVRDDSSYLCIFSLLLLRFFFVFFFASVTFHVPVLPITAQSKICQWVSPTGKVFPASSRSPPFVCSPESKTTIVSSKHSSVKLTLSVYRKSH